MYSFLFVFFALTLALYIEEIVFILKHFKISKRKKKTIWILAFHSVFSGCGLIGCIVPRSGTLIDMVSNLFFGTCLYNFGQLLVNYMGGGERVWHLIGPDRRVQLNTPPLCCCCVCIPPAKLTRSVFFRISLAIMQVAIVRPIIMFFAAVLWTNGSYAPGHIDQNGAFIYFTIVNTISSFVAVYGLMLLRGAFRPELERDFHITGKIFSIQLAIIISAIPNLILSILVATGVIPCGPIFPSESRAEGIYHVILVLVMLPFSILARYFFRRKYDGYGIAGPQSKVSAAASTAVTATAVAIGASLNLPWLQHGLQPMGNGQEDEEEQQEDGEEEGGTGSEYTSSNGGEFMEEDEEEEVKRPVLKWPSETHV